MNGGRFDSHSVGGDVMKCLRVSATLNARSDDSALVHATRQGDAEAFEELVKRYDFRLLRIAFHVTHNREDAEEAVQDAFLKAYTNLDQFEETASFSTWLTRIVVNESLIKLRKEGNIKKHKTSLTDQLEERITFEIADWAPNPEQLYSATELRGILIKSLESLRPALTVVFVLRDVVGLAGDEAAEVLSLAPSSVRARLFRARLQLREKLSKYFRKSSTSDALHGSLRDHPPILAVKAVSEMPVYVRRHSSP